MAKGKHIRTSKRNMGIAHPAVILIVLAALICAAVIVCTKSCVKDEGLLENDSGITVFGVVSTDADGCTIVLEKEMNFSADDGKSCSSKTLHFAEGSIVEASPYVGYPVNAEIDVVAVEDDMVYATLLSIAPELFEIPMEYGTFVYPARWNDLVSVEESGEPGDLTYAFHCVDFGGDVLLFEIAYLDEPEGSVFAVIEADSRELYACVKQGDVPDGLSESDFLRYQAMIDDVNYLMAGTKYSKGVELVG